MIVRIPKNQNGDPKSEMNKKNSPIGIVNQIEKDFYMKFLQPINFQAVNVLPCFYDLELFFIH